MTFAVVKENNFIERTRMCVDGQIRVLSADAEFIFYRLGDFTD